MLDEAISALGARRLLWGCDLTMCTGLAKLHALEVIGEHRRHRRDSLGERREHFPAEQLSAVHGGVMIDVNALIGPILSSYPHPDPETLIRVLDRRCDERG
jgi:hypothetical protein